MHSSHLLRLWTPSHTIDKPHTIRNTISTSQLSLLPASFEPHHSRTVQSPEMKASMRKDYSKSRKLPVSFRCRMYRLHGSQNRRLHPTKWPSSWINFPVLLRMESDPRYVRVHSLKSFLMPKWELWSDSAPNKLYTLIKTSSGTSSRSSWKEGYSNNEASLRDFFWFSVCQTPLLCLDIATYTG